MTSTVHDGRITAVELSIGGMTCASCAARIEKKLNRMDGVTATVNYATEKAKVSYAGDVQVADLIATVVKTGYTAEEPPPPEPEPDLDAPRAEQAQETAADVRDPALAALRQRLLVSAGLALPVVLLAMVPALQFDNWQWLSLTLAAPVVVWGALPFHRAAWTNARHGAATMDTLVSVGTLAAFAWSLWALFFGHAGMPGMRHGFALFTVQGARSPVRTAPPPSTWRSRQASSASSCSAAIWRPARSARRARPSRPCWNWAPRTSPCCARAGRSASR